MNDSPFGDFPNTLDMDNAARVTQPMIRVLGDFVSGWDADARTATVTTLVVSLWQISGRGMSHISPSLILLNATSSEPDPIDSLAALLVNEDPEVTAPGRHRDGAYANCDPQYAASTMAIAIEQAAKLNPASEYDRQELLGLESLYFAAQHSGFGTGRSRPYSKAWHECFGLITPGNNQLILRLESDDDRFEFRRHLREGSADLTHPTGYGARLREVVKHISISGSLDPDLWDGEMARKMVGFGLPFVFLPHTVVKPPAIPNPRVFGLLPSLIAKRFTTPVEEPANLMPDEWTANYGRILRRRLRELPSAYEYSMQRAVRQLFPVCKRLASTASKWSPGDTAAERDALFLDLYRNTLRGMVIGVAGLAWHGIGFDPGCDRNKAVTALRNLRKDGSVSLSDLLTGARLTKEERDSLVERFAAEGLLRVEGKRVTAATYEEFVTFLYACPEFAPPPGEWAALQEKRAAEAKG